MPIRYYDDPRQGIAPPKGDTLLCKKELSALSTIRLTLSNAVINGKQNDTATLQSTDTLLLKHRPTLNGTSCLPNPRCPIELQVPLGYTDSYLALSREPFGLPDLVPTHNVSDCKIIGRLPTLQTFWLCKPCRN